MSNISSFPSINFSTDLSIPDFLRRLADVIESKTGPFSRGVPDGGLFILVESHPESGVIVRTVPIIRNLSDLDVLNLAEHVKFHITHLMWSHPEEEP